MRLKILLLSALLLLCGMCTGCVYGLLYTNTTEPLVLNMDRTPRGPDQAFLDTKQVKGPFSGVNLSAEWNSKAIGDAAKKAGIKKIFYADMQTFSILGGLWKKETVRVRGEK